MLDYGKLRQGLGSFELAETIYQHVLELPLACYGLDDDEELLSFASKSCKSSALLCLGRLWSEHCRLKEAQSALETALQYREELYSETSIEVAEVLLVLGQLLLTTWTGGFLHAMDILSRALAIYQATLGPTCRPVAIVLEKMAEGYITLAQFPKAIGLLKRAQSIYERASGTLGTDDDDASVQHNLGKCYAGMGRYKEAQQYYRHALDWRRRVLGASHPLVAHTMRNMAFLLFAMGESDRSEAMYNEALQILRALYGERDHLEVAYVLNDLGLLYNHRADYRRALALFEQSLKIRERLVGDDHVDTAVALNNIGNAHRKRGSFALAEEYYRRALRIRCDRYSENNPEIARTLHNLALCAIKLSKFDQANELLEQSKRIREASLGRKHPEMGSLYNALGDLHFRQGAFAAALDAYSQSLAINEQLFGSLDNSTHPYLGIIALKLAKTHERLGDLERAENYLQASLHQADVVFGAASQITQSRAHQLEKFLSGCAAKAASRADFAAAREQLNKQLRIVQQYPSKRAGHRIAKIQAHLEQLPAVSPLRRSAGSAATARPAAALNPRHHAPSTTEPAPPSQPQRPARTPRIRQNKARIWIAAAVVLALAVLLFVLAIVPPQQQ